MTTYHLTGYNQGEYRESGLRLENEGALLEIKTKGLEGVLTWFENLEKKYSGKKLDSLRSI